MAYVENMCQIQLRLNYLSNWILLFSFVSAIQKQCNKWRGICGKYSQNTLSLFGLTFLILRIKNRVCRLPLGNEENDQDSLKNIFYMP